MKYKCIYCKKMIELDLNKNKILCPLCGYRIIEKVRSEGVKRVDAV